MTAPQQTCPSMPRQTTTGAPIDAWLCLPFAALAILSQSSTCKPPQGRTQTQPLSISWNAYSAMHIVRSALDPMEHNLVSQSECSVTCPWLDAALSSSLAVRFRRLACGSSVVGASHSAVAAHRPRPPARQSASSSCTLQLRLRLRLVGLQGCRAGVSSATVQTNFAGTRD